MRRFVLVLAPLACAFTAAAQQPLYDLRAPQPGAELGADVAPLGDLDGDGRGDFAVGGPGGDGLEPGSGVVWAYSGADGTVLWTFEGERTGDRAGAALAAIGDADGDGAGDLVVGAPGYDDPLGGVDAGRAYVVSGVDGAVIRLAFGNQPGEQAGFDVVGMGADHYAVSAPGWDAGLLFLNRGRVYVYDVATGAQQYVETGDQDGERYGHALGDAGDASLDGVHDLLVGAPGHDLVGFPFSALDGGRVDCLSAASGSLLYSVEGGGGSQLGWSVGGGFDLDADGWPDFVAGAPTAPMSSGGPAQVGRVTAYSGAPGNPVLWSLEGAADGDELGGSVALFGDATGDGVPDAMAGAPGTDVGGSADAGAATLLSGANGQVQYVLNGFQAGDRMGDAVGSGGLVNQDGFVDPIGCAPQADTPLTGGWARCTLGAAPAPAPYCTAKVNSAGCLPVISYTGAPSVSVSADQFHVFAANVLEGKAGILIWSLTSQAAPFFGGTLCVKAPIKRTPLQTSTTQSSFPSFPCAGYYTFGFDQAYRASQGLGAGDTVYLQYWSRDSGLAAPNSIGLTGGLRVLVHP